MPYFFGNWGLRLRVPLRSDQSLEPFYRGHYTHEFFRSWESLGDPSFKNVIPTQVSHDLGLTWLVQTNWTAVFSTLEVCNVTNAALFDFYGVQRPGRAVYLKVTGEIY
jgi:homoserine trans-succinylase